MNLIDGNGTINNVYQCIERLTQLDDEVDDLMFQHCIRVVVGDQEGYVVPLYQGRFKTSSTIVNR